MYNRVKMPRKVSDEVEKGHTSPVGELKPLIDSKIKDYDGQRWMYLTWTNFNGYI